MARWSSNRGSIRYWVVTLIRRSSARHWRANPNSRQFAAPELPRTLLLSTGVKIGLASPFSRLRGGPARAMEHFGEYRGQAGDQGTSLWEDARPLIGHG